MKNLSKIFGIILIGVGTLGFVIAGIVHFTEVSDLDQGALPASAFFLVMIGMAFCFPTLLRENKTEVSTMRVVVFAVVMVFCVIEIKIGWTAGSFSEFTIDSTWIYILGLAFGSKAFQRFAEDNQPDVDGTKGNPA